MNKITIQTAKDGSPVPFWNDYQLHSIYEPKKEGITLAEKFITQIDDFEKPLLILGLGFAYHISPLLEKFQEIYIAESCLELIQKAKEIIELQPVFAKCKIIDKLSDVPNISDYHIFTLRSETRFQEKFFTDVQKLMQTSSQNCIAAVASNEAITSDHATHHSPNSAPNYEIGDFCYGLKTLNSLRVLVNSPIYGGSYTTAKYVVSALQSLGVCARLSDHSAAEALLYKYMNIGSADSGRTSASPTGGKSEISATDAYKKLIQPLTDMLSETLWIDIQNFKPHLVFFMAQSPFNNKIINDIKKSGIVSIYWFVEDFRRFPYWKNICSDFDFFFMIQKGEFEDILQKICSRIWGWFPVAAEPKTHKPVKLSENDKSFYGSDISFMGAAYPNRVNFFKRFNKNNLKLWGTGWTETELSNYNIPLKEQRISIEQSNMIYQATKININLHSVTGMPTTANSYGKVDVFDTHGDFVNPRTFEIAACGGFQLCDDRPAVREMFDADKDIVFFSSVEEAIDKANYYLKNDELRQKIARAGQEKTLKFHTYELRLKNMLNIAIQHSPILSKNILQESDRLQELLKKINDKEFEKFIYSIEPALRSSFETILSKVKSSKDTLKNHEAYIKLLETFYTGE